MDDVFNIKNPPFTRLTGESQVLLAAWAVLALSEPLQHGEKIPTDMTHALADLMRKARPHYRNRQTAPGNKSRRPRTPWRTTS